MTVRTASASTALRELLRGPSRTATVLAAFPRAVYLALDDEPVSSVTVAALVTADGVAHPNALVLAASSATRPLARFHRGARVVLGLGGVTAPAPVHCELRVTRWWDPRPRLRPVSLPALRDHLDRCVRITGVADPSLSEPLATITTLLAAGRPDAAAAAGRALVGAGPGLTPAGDDVLAGLFAGIAVLAPAIGPWCAAVAADAVATGDRVAAGAVDRTTSVSAALLRHAVRGQVAQPAADWLHALAGRGSPEAATRALLRVGATSGHDLLTGVLAAGRLVTDVPVHRPLVERSS